MDQIQAKIFYIRWNYISFHITGSACIFPFTFNGVTYVSCAEWVYGGEFQGQKWCSTKVDSSGVHVNGEGKYGICGTDCNPTISLASILAGLGINTQTRAAQFTQSQAERIMGSWQL